MLNRIRQLITQQVDFAFETTLSTKSYPSLINEAKANGYEVWLLFFWLPTPEMAMERVTSRVANGGHFIPKDVIIRRHKRGIENLTKVYTPIVDNWFVFNNSSLKPELIAKGNQSIDIEVYNSDLGERLNKY